MLTDHFDSVDEGSESHAVLEVGVGSLLEQVAGQTKVVVADGKDEGGNALWPLGGEVVWTRGVQASPKQQHVWQRAVKQCVQGQSFVSQHVQPCPEEWKLIRSVKGEPFVCV